MYAISDSAMPVFSCTCLCKWCLPSFVRLQQTFSVVYVVTGTELCSQDCFQMQLLAAKSCYILYDNTNYHFQSTGRPWNSFHPLNGMMSSNLVWISNELNSWSIFKHWFSQLARLIETIFTRHVGRSDYFMFKTLLILLAASCGGRGSACSQDSDSNMGHLWFVIQIWTKWSYKTIFIAWIHYNQQYSILKLEK